MYFSTSFGKSLNVTWLEKRNWREKFPPFHGILFISWNLNPFLGISWIFLPFMEFYSFHGISFIIWNFIPFMEFHPFHGISIISWILNPFLGISRISWIFLPFMDFPPFHRISSICDFHLQFSYLSDMLMFNPNFDLTIGVYWIPMPKPVTMTVVQACFCQVPWYVT